MKCFKCMKEYTKGRAKFCPYCGAPYRIDERNRTDYHAPNDSSVSKIAFPQEADRSEDDVWKDYDWYADELEAEKQDEAEIKKMNKRFIIIESILLTLAVALAAAIFFITLKQ